MRRQNALSEAGCEASFGIAVSPQHGADAIAAAAVPAAAIDLEITETASTTDSHQAQSTQ